MAPCAQMRTLRNHRIVTNPDFIHAIDSYTITYSNKVSHNQIPWGPYLNCRMNVNMLPQLRTKQSEQQNAPGMKRARTDPKKQHIDHTPYCTKHTIAKRK